MFVGLRPEWQPLVNCDIANAELSRFLDEGDADVVVEEKALSVRSPLRIGLPCGDRMALREHVHPLEIACLIRIHASVQQDAMHSLHLLDDARGRLSFLDL